MLARMQRPPETESRRHRICDIVQFHSPISGGIRRYVEDKARFYATGEQVDHAVLIPGPANRTWREGNTTWVQMASPRMPGSKSYRLFLSKSGMHRFLESFRPDLIEVADPYQSAWMALAWARRRNVPVVLCYHSDYPRAWHRTVQRYAGRRLAGMAQALIGRYLRKLFTACDGMLVSTRKYERLWGEGFDIPVTRVPFGFDSEVFRPSPGKGLLRRHLPPGRGDARIALYAGRLAREKRVVDVLDAFAVLRSRDPNLELVIVGDGESHEHLRRHASRNGIPVTWLPFVDDRGVLAACYSEAAVFVHAGSCETFGYTVLEAAACGTPSVVCNGSGLEEAALCHPRSRRVTGREPATIAAAIEAVLIQPESLESRWSVYRELCRERSLTTFGNRILEHNRFWIEAAPRKRSALP